LFQKYDKNKNRALLTMYFAPPNLKTCLQACIERFCGRRSNKGSDLGAL